MSDTDDRPPGEEQPVADPPPSWSSRLFELARWGTLPLVVGGIAWAAWNARKDFEGAQVLWGQIGYGWLALSGLLYLIATFPCGVYWWELLFALGERPPFYAALRAYFIGHVGKYVPGKFMVIVLRAGLLAEEGVDATVSSICVFIETLTFMSVAAFLGAAILGWLFLTQEAAFGPQIQESKWLLLGVAVVAVFVAGLPTLPPLCRRIVKLLQVARAKENIDESLEGLGYTVIGYGWVLNLVAWMLLGASYWACLKALDGALVGSAGTPIALDLGPANYPHFMATVALAMVAGFVIPLPGGLGGRELVLGVLIAPLLGPVPAAVSAVALRLVWLMAEALAATILYFVPPVGPACRAGPGG